MWENIWSQMQEANHQSYRFGGDWKDWRIESSIWFDEKKPTLNYARQQRSDAIRGLVIPGGRVLDIGAGAGQISIAVADRASWVTAVEPARGMISIFKRNLEKSQKTNIDLVPVNWETIDIHNDLCPYYDLTIASYSLEMTDLKNSIRKMQAVTRGKVVIYWYGKDEDAEREARALWPLLHQWPYCPVPKSNVVINLLYEMGIKPDFNTFSYTESTRYESVEDALVDYAIRYNAVTRRQLHLLRGFIEREFEKVAGGFVRTHNHTDMQIIWQV